MTELFPVLSNPMPTTSVMAFLGWSTHLRPDWLLNRRTAARPFMKSCARTTDHCAQGHSLQRRRRNPSNITSVLTEQFISMECDAFHVAYLSDKIPEAVFHGQAVKTVAYLRV